MEDQKRKKEGKWGRSFKTLKNETILDTALCSKARKRLKIPVKDLHPNQMLQIGVAILSEISDWVYENPEGFQLPYDMGYLAISKYALIPFRENRYEIVNKIKNLSEETISERFKEIVLKKYGKELSKLDIAIFLKKGKVLAIPMWFNHRNCSFKKAMVYKWMPPLSYKKKVNNADLSKYYYFNFDDFYNYKVKNIEE